MWPSGVGSGAADDVIEGFNKCCATSAGRATRRAGREAATRRAWSQSPQTPPRESPTKAMPMTLVSLGVAAARAAACNPNPSKGFVLPARAGKCVAAVAGVASAPKCSLKGRRGSAVSLIRGAAS